jgi:hypothetical protein
MHKKDDLTETFTLDKHELADLLDIEYSEHDRLDVKVYGNSQVELQIIRVPRSKIWRPGDE